MAVAGAGAIRVASLRDERSEPVHSITPCCKGMPGLPPGPRGRIHDMCRRDMAREHDFSFHCVLRGLEYVEGV